MHFTEYMLDCYEEVMQMKDGLILVGVVAFWIVLQKYILPRLGVPT
jgi:hypothetical protein